MSQKRAPAEARPNNNRSAVTNRTRLFPKGVDGRRADGRRWRDCYYEYLGQIGGEESASAYQIGVVRDLVTIKLALEKEQAKQYVGEPFDLAG